MHSLLVKNTYHRFSGEYIILMLNEAEFPMMSSDNPTEPWIKKCKLHYKKAKKPRPKEELRWSQFKRITPTEKMLEHVRYNVFPFIKTLNGTTSPFTKHMANAVFIIEKPTLLFEAINKIEEIFVEIERDASEGGHTFQDIQGDVYEMLLSEIARQEKTVNLERQGISLNLWLNWLSRN
jgi:type I restriction enzyme M protein